MGKIGTTPPFRRSTRVNISCPVRISGMSANHLPFAETAQVVTVSKFGARLKTSTPLVEGTQIKLKPLFGKNSGTFKVVWVGREGTPRAGEVGLEHATEIADILGIKFPDHASPTNKPA